MRRLTAGALDAGLHRGSSARTFRRRRARWPGSTSTLGALRQVGVQPRPVADQAVGFADRHLVAGPVSQTMRRATRPAIWTATTSWPSGVRISTLLRSLSWLAAASSAERYMPGGARPATTSPLIGTRWTWASKIDRKMLMRGSGVVGQVRVRRAAPRRRRGRPARRRGRRRRRGGWAAPGAGGGRTPRWRPPPAGRRCAATVAAARRGHREARADERQAGGVHRGNRGSRQGHQSRGA